MVLFSLDSFLHQTVYFHNEIEIKLKWLLHGNSVQTTAKDIHVGKRGANKENLPFLCVKRKVEGMCKQKKYVCPGVKGTQMNQTKKMLTKSMFLFFKIAHF